MPKNGRGGARAGAGGARPGAGRPRKVKPVAAAAPEQLDLLDAIEAAKQSEHADPIEPAATDRERLKAIAIDRGVVWVREILATRGAARLSELSDEQVRFRQRHGLRDGLMENIGPQKKARG